MFADVTMQVKILGGMSLTAPINRLQNALSFNFYANTEMYDARADSVVFEQKFDEKGILDLDATYGSSKAAKIVDGTIAAADLTGAQSGSAPIFGARAWVNFNGTGTVAIRASGNVSSITDNGTGDYTVNFTTALPDANYAIAGNIESAGGNSALLQASAAMGTAPSGAQRSTSSCRILTTSSSSTLTDAAAISVFFIR